MTGKCNCVFFFKQKTAYEMRISDWSSDVCSSDLSPHSARPPRRPMNAPEVGIMLRARLNDELKVSMKAKDPLATSTLRLILAALKDRDIAARDRKSVV